jgi:hypothetical protein
MSVFRSVLANTLKETLNQIITDDYDGIQSKVVFKKFCQEIPMSDAYEDDLETAGPGFASDTDEGTEIPLGNIREGAMTRYIARKFALKLVVSEEMMEDGKYPEAIPAARMLKKCIWDTADMDAALMLVRATNTGYVGGDGLPLASASHTLPNGGTFSNVMATPMTPSRAAWHVAVAAIRTFPGHNGIRSRYKAERVLCPVEQESTWEELTESTMAPEPGNFATINIIKRANIEVVGVTHWTNTTTNWAVQTDAENGLSFRWRAKPKSKTWVDDDYDVMKYGIRARWARGWSNARNIYFVEA